MLSRFIQVPTGPSERIKSRVRFSASLSLRGMHEKIHSATTGVKIYF